MKKMNIIQELIKNCIYVILIIISFISCGKSHELIFIEAESFTDLGGWVVDQQSIDIMGSAYLLAHGLGVPVNDAETTIEAPVSDNYRIWVRTRDWAAPWKVEGSPGKFQILINDVPHNPIFGTESAYWHWQDGGTIYLEEGTNEISLRDLTGFGGRCDAIIFTTNQNFLPPEEDKELDDFRRKSLGFDSKPKDMGEFDLVVVGGGMGGICTAISSARYGLKVALIQNRPVLGGNNSSEVRVGLSGLIYQQPYPKLGNIVDEIGSVGHWTLWEAQRDPDTPRSRKILEEIAKHPEKKIHNAGPASNYGDEKKINVVENEPNISLFLNTHVFHAEIQRDRIISVIGRNILSGEELEIRGKLFADCTGDGNLGYLAGADYRVGREGRHETGETLAPEVEDNLVMGTSVQWYAEEEDNVSTFPDCSSWAITFDEYNYHMVTRGDWDWEVGIGSDQITEIEFIRDYAFRIIFGNWDFLKNNSKAKEEFANHELKWVAFIGGKRESRRLLGDVILKEQDILNQVDYPDASFTTTWGIDLHYPVESDEHHRIEPYRSVAPTRIIKPYPIPYRCLYSRNINNLFMAGRNISVTHVALGSVRVMRTIGMMGEVVGMAASICKENDVLPRDVFENYLNELQNKMAVGVPQTSQ